MKTANLGFPRIGRRRELKKAVEAYWKGKIEECELQQVCRDLREANWCLQQDLGIEHIPSNDFSLYDQMLDITAMVGAVPARFDWDANQIELDQYFAMARGVFSQPGKADVAAMEMTKWFDTNYHYIVPELAADQKFHLASRKPIEDFLEAKRLGIVTRPVLVGPVTYLLLGKCVGDTFDRLSLLDRILPVYEGVLQELQSAGAQWVQIDEPVLVLDLDDRQREAFARVYQRLKEAAPRLSILVATYFGELRDNAETACRLPVDGLHLDLVQGRSQLETVLDYTAGTMTLSLGVIDGRNIWRADLDEVLTLVKNTVEQVGTERLLVAPACSLLHIPIDLDMEKSLEPNVRHWLAFAKQKLEEVRVVATAVDEGKDAVAEELEASRSALTARNASPEVHDPEVNARSRSVTPEMCRRGLPFAARRELQQRHLGFPLLPTTTIGSFPQTREVRRVRADYKAGRQTREEYETFVKEQMAKTIRFQEEVGLDVLVHGEFERNDMVEYFGEQLCGFTFTQNGWVQSYGSRCVKPPIIYGDVSRPRPMTVEWITHAKSLTEKPIKGMLTGPVTILQWSFVRNDQPQRETCRQIALAIRDEVMDLEAAGVPVIQIDEAALREGLPLRRNDWNDYLTWAVECFRLASSGVRDVTQIHTHMCYSEFNDIVAAILDMDADVISIEAARSRMELLHAFRNLDYPNEIGPGVYDIHSPHVPTAESIQSLLESALEVFDPQQIWVNPDCGLKTRKWEEVAPALTNMMAAARAVRKKYAKLPAYPFDNSRPLGPEG